MAGKRKTTAWVLTALACLLLVAGGCKGDEDTTYTSEGALSAPVDISAFTPYTGQVGSDPSYYSSFVDFANPFAVQLSGMRYDLDLLVYDNAIDALTAYAAAPLCASVTIGIVDESCPSITTATGTPIYIKVVSHNELGSTFSLSVIP